MINAIILILIGIVPVLFPPQTSAHAFGALYTLPVPVWLYLYGGAAAVVISFVIVGVFLNQPKKEFKYPFVKLLSLKNTAVIKSLLKYMSLFLFLLTITTGLAGTPDSLLNFNMTFFWIIFFLGLNYFTGLFGDIWPIINPWKTLTELSEKFIGVEFKGILRYPKKLSHFPALVFYFLLIWTELVSRVNPYSLSLRLIIYSLISFIAIFLFGKVTWLEYFDFFSVFFGFIGKLSPIYWKDKKVYLRAPFVGLIDGRAKSISQVFFIIFMLSSTAFDGFHSTTLWFRFELNYLVNIEQSLGSIGYPLIQTLALAFSLLLFFIIYIAFITMIKVIVKTELSVKDLSLDFAYSLIPIAFVYNIAHYYTLLLIQGQSIIPLISDPFGFGWNLFNTANFTINIGLLGANFIWNSQVFFIILGHIAGVYLAHLIALRIFPTHKKALISQFPMLILMVCYTVIGLWILSQPYRAG